VRAPPQIGKRLADWKLQDDGRVVEHGRRVLGHARRILARATRRTAGWGLGGDGWAVLTATVVAWWVGARYGWAEFTVLAGLTGFVLLAAVASAVGRSRYAVTLDLAQRRVCVGERAVGRVEVRNVSTRALLPAEIELPVGAGLAVFPLPRLAPAAVHDDIFAVPTQRRCVIVVGPVRSVRGDPLGLVRREVRWTEPIELFVHPRTVPLHGAAAGFLKDLEGRPTRDLSASDVSFHALREYVAGDDRRHVHWKSTARTGQLMVKQYEETRRSHLAVALSSNPVDYEDPDEFELAVSVAGSLGIQALREEKEITVVLQGGVLPGGSANRLLDDLTRVTLDAGRDDIVTLAKNVGSSVVGASVIVLLFGGGVTPAQMREATIRLPLDVRVIAIQCVLGAELKRRAIAALTVLTVGDLSQLPKAMRSVVD
jgi:uncharacterized protein (DUF58 family)